MLAGRCQHALPSLDPQDPLANATRDEDDIDAMGLFDFLLDPGSLDK